MTKRKVIKPVIKKHDRLKKYTLVVLQALLGAFIVVWFFLYSLSATLTIQDTFSKETYTASFLELNSNYYDSESYNKNYSKAIEDILRYIVIREQLETDGVYNKDKIIYVGAFAHRNDSEPYVGPDAAYYLDDLIKWGQRKVSHDYKFFFSWEEYYNFFGLSEEIFRSLYEPDEFVTDEADINTKEDSYSKEEDNAWDDVTLGDNGEYISQAETYSLASQPDKVVAYLDTINNRYTSIDGKNIENYVDNGEDYEALSKCLEDTINSIYYNYQEYLKYQEYFQEDNTNVKYCVAMSIDGNRTLFTNVSLINGSTSENKIDELMKGYGEYVYACPATLDYLTNTHVPYDVIRQATVDRYSYAYNDDTKIWISLDKSFSVSDVFSINETAHTRSSRMIPWMISLSALSFIAFFSIGAWIIINEKKKYSYEGAVNDLTDFDRLPIEINILFFVLLVLVLIIGESIIFKNIRATFSQSMGAFIVPVSLLLGIDIFIALLFIYGFVRRIICKNVLEGSLIGLILPVFGRLIDKISKKMDSLYDESGLPVRVIFSYLLFLLVNVFLVSLVFFSGYPFISLTALIIFDLIIGIAYFKRSWERKEILDYLKRINAGENDIYLDLVNYHGQNKVLAKEINNVGIGISKAVEISIKDEKLKADLITNVSHDIKTPLTSIINYVNLIKREDIDNENVKKYVEVLEEKSQRLRQLTIDLVEASKISSGNIILEFAKINFIELLLQTEGEFEEKFEEKGLNIVQNVPNNPVYVMVDPRRIWRVIENLFNNIYKYALENTRVYVDLIETDDENGKWIHMSVKNVSKNELNIPADELTERFIRGDVSRSTEGSGLGLSIAKSLTLAQNGKFDIYLDGDLFKVTLSFPIALEEDDKKQEL